MNSKSILLTIILLLSSHICAQISFAILPMEDRSKEPELTEQALSGLYKYILDSKKYTIVERTQIEKVLDEQALQLSGLIEQNEAINIGKLLGVDKLIVSSFSKLSSNTYALSLNVIDVITGEIELSDQESQTGTLPVDLAMWCISKIRDKYPLTGKILGEVGNSYVVNLGSKNGLEKGDRLFIARNEILRDNSGEILFQNIYRLGTAEVEEPSDARSLIKVRSLLDENQSIQKDDLVSPEPIPKKDPIVSHSPLNPAYIKGQLILHDDMQNNKHLSPQGNTGEDYLNGKLNLDGRNKNRGYVKCYYSAPYDQLTDCVIEVEMKFEKASNKYNMVDIGVRRTPGNCYSFCFDDEGRYKILKWLSYKAFEIVPYQTTTAIKRGESVNTFCIVALGSRFDFYLNNEFVIGFEDEYYEEGALGFATPAPGYITIDDVKIWEVGTH